MKHIRKTLFLCGILIITSFCCEEEATLSVPCGCESETIERYENVDGTILRFDTLYFIQIQVPDGLISVEPCEGLNNEFKMEGLKVIVSGDLKKICPVGTPNTKVFAPHPFTFESIQISN